jgi:prepilin-type N-terminal cleavage/methylation domain-containing protein
VKVLRDLVVAHRDDRGLSLAELLVTMTIFGIMMTVVVGLFSTYTKSVTLARTIDANVRTASNGMNEMSRIVRAGTNNPVRGSAVPEPAFSQAQREALTVYAFINLASSETRPVKVQFSIDAQRNLVETTTAAVALGGGYWAFTGAVSTRKLASAVAVPGAGELPLFTYRDADAAALPTDASGALTATQRQGVASVTVNLRIKSSSTSSDNGVTLQNTVGIPNLSVTGVGP